MFIKYKTNNRFTGYLAIKAGFTTLLAGIFIIFTFVGCDHNLKADFNLAIDSEKPNYAGIKNTTKGHFDSVLWTIRGHTFREDSKFEAYFPFAGQHEIRLVVSNDSDHDTIIKKVNITRDDPDYLNKLKPVWEENFNGEQLNMRCWSFATGAHGWGNQELQNYTKGDNLTLKNGKLTIDILKVDNKKEPGSYTSSRIHTSGKKEFQYGRIEARAKLPSGKGIWAAIWMLGSNIDSVGWPACGEMDIMEYVGFEPNTIHSTVHIPAGYAGNGDGSNMEVKTCEENFHTYGMLWTPSELVFYVDSIRNVVHTYAPNPKNADNWPLNQPAFIILNVAVGGTWGGLEGVDNTIFPQTMEIDHVKVYQAPYIIKNHKQYD